MLISPLSATQPAAGSAATIGEEAAPENPYPEVGRR